MRSTLTLRVKRAIQIAIVITMLVVPSGALALSGVTDAPVATTAGLHAAVTPRVARLGQAVTVRGAAPASAAGHRAVLESASRTRSGWHPLLATTIATGGRFAFRTQLRHSGYVRVIDAGPVASGSGVQADRSAIPAGSASVPQRVGVTARFEVAQTRLDALAGHPVSLRGTLSPAHGGRLVRVQARQGHGWKTFGTARTDATGRFRAHLGALTGAEHRLRVRFAGDHSNAAVSGGAGLVTVFSADVASWYNDAGNTACGFHATLGVANRNLPCGTKVRIRFGHRSVTATVDDRGPYVGGRNWDLNQSTAAALGFGGVGAIWISL
jgi:rare lipoprotein A